MATAAPARLTRAQLYARISALPDDQAHEAQLLMLEVYGRSARKAGVHMARDPIHRASFVGDPERYFREILGTRTITPQQARVLRAIEDHDRVLVVSGNNLGKSYLLSAYCVYWMDARAAASDPVAGRAERGARLLLPGPDAATVRGTIWGEINDRIREAESRGHMMPGVWSEKAVRWYVAPLWDAQALTPQRRTGERIAASASGRHHPNQLAVMDEGGGTREAVWGAMETSCSGPGNKLLVLINPHEASGPAFQRYRSPAWHVVELSALDHPNVRERRIVIRGAIDFRVIDATVRARCVDLGPASSTKPDPKRHDFAYALPSLGTPERGPRADGIVGHPAAEPRIYRPDSFTTSSVLGQFPSDREGAPFSPAAIQRAIERGRGFVMPSRPPDAIGLDVALEGEDDTCAMPRWGPPVDVAIRALQGVEGASAEDVARVREENLIILGPITTHTHGDGPEVAQDVARRWREGAFTCDSAPASVGDHLGRVLGRSVGMVTFVARPDSTLPGEDSYEDLRAQMYGRLAWAFALDLVVLLQDDARLVEELLAQRTEPGAERFVEVLRDKRRRRERVKLTRFVAKPEIKATLGRSPDASDAAVLAVNEPRSARRRGKLGAAPVLVMTGGSYD